MARRYAGNATDAEDLVQDTLVLALRFFPGYREGTNIRAWLGTVMRNRYFSIVRRRRLEQHVLDTEGRHALADWSVGENGRNAMDRDGGVYSGSGFSDPVASAIAGLPREFREAVLLCDVEGLSYAEAARRAQRPIGTIMSRLHRGRAALRRQLVSRRNLEAA